MISSLPQTSQLSGFLAGEFRNHHTDAHIRVHGAVLGVSGHPHMPDLSFASDWKGNQCFTQRTDLSLASSQVPAIPAQSVMPTEKREPLTFSGSLGRWPSISQNRLILLLRVYLGGQEVLKREGLGSLHSASSPPMVHFLLRSLASSHGNLPPSATPSW